MLSCTTCCVSIRFVRLWMCSWRKHKKGWIESSRNAFPWRRGKSRADPTLKLRPTERTRGTPLCQKRSMLHVIRPSYQPQARSPVVWNRGSVNGSCWRVFRYHRWPARYPPGHGRGSNDRNKSMPGLSSRRLGTTYRRTDEKFLDGTICSQARLEKERRGAWIWPNLDPTRPPPTPHSLLWDKKTGKGWNQTVILYKIVSVQGFYNKSNYIADICRSKLRKFKNSKN